MTIQKTNDIDHFIAAFPEETQKLLQQIRTTIKEAAPDAEECISYGIPTLKYKGNLVHFSAYKAHIGFYPTASGIAVFKNELSAYKCSKGAVQFPIGQPLPLEIITRIVKFRLKENTEKAEAKKTKNRKNPKSPG